MPLRVRCFAGVSKLVRSAAGAEPTGRAYVEDLTEPSKLDDDLTEPSKLDKAGEDDEMGAPCSDPSVASPALRNAIIQAWLALASFVARRWPFLSPEQSEVKPFYSESTKQASEATLVHHESTTLSAETGSTESPDAECVRIDSSEFAEDQDQSRTPEPEVAVSQPRSIYHGARQTFDELRKLLPKMVAAGFDAVQLPPAQASPAGHLRKEWHLRYQPTQYTVIDPQLGGESALRRLCTEAARCGVAVIADCVFSHMAVVATRAEWEAAQEDEELLERLKSRLDKAFAPDLTRDDFQWPWICLDGGWGKDACRYEGWARGELSKLRFCEHVLQVHGKHLELLIKCGVQGFCLSAASQMQPAQIKKYVDLLRSQGAAFIYADVQSAEPGVHALYNSLQDGLPTTDHILSTQLRTAAASENACRVFPQLAALKDHGQPAVRLTRSHDMALIDRSDEKSGSDDLCGAKAACSYLLARPQGSVLVHRRDMCMPAVQRAVAFRRAVAEHGALGFDSETAADAAAFMTAELCAWPPPSYKLLAMLLRARDGTPLGVVAMNFTSAPHYLQLPWGGSEFILREVLAGSAPEAQNSWVPQLGQPFPMSETTAWRSVLAGDARFFLIFSCQPHPSLQAAGVSAPEPALQIDCQILEIFYRSGWQAPHLHFGVRDQWTPGQGWPMTRLEPAEDDRLQLLGAGVRAVPDGDGCCWWRVQVPVAASSGPVEFVFNDGQSLWENSPGGGNYQATAAGTYIVTQGVLKRVEPDRYTVACGKVPEEGVGA